MKEQSKENMDQLVRKRTRIAIIAALSVFLLYLIHMFIVQGSSSFFSDMSNGDVKGIILNLGFFVFNGFVLVGWFIVFRIFRKIP